MDTHSEKFLTVKDQEIKTQELITLFEKLFSSTQRQELTHLNAHEGPGNFPDETMRTVSFEKKDSPQIKLTTHENPSEPIQKGLICKTIFIEAPVNKSFDLLEYGLNPSILSAHALQDLNHDLRFQKLIIGNLVTYSPITIPEKGIGYGSTIEGIRDFAPHFTWQGFSVYGPYKDSMNYHPEDKDTPHMRSCFLLFAEEILKRFQKGLEVQNFLTPNPSIK